MKGVPYVFRKIKWYLCLRFPLYKLYCIRRALKLDRRQWQTDFALGHSDWLPPSEDRQSGKTVAVMLRILMGPPGDIANYTMLSFDPDYSRRIDRWYIQIYIKLSRICKEAGIPVPDALAWCKL